MKSMEDSILGDVAFGGATMKTMHGKPTPVKSQTFKMRKPLNNSINLIEYTLHFVIRVFWESKSRVLQ